jgi:transposase
MSTSATRTPLPRAPPPGTATRDGHPLDAANSRRHPRLLATPRAMAHLRQPHVRLRCPSRGDRPLAGHATSRISALVYRHQLRPIMEKGAQALGQLAQTEARMVAVLDDLGLTELMTIAGLTVTGAAAILAETGDPNRFATPRSLVNDRSRTITLARTCPRRRA